MIFRKLKYFLSVSSIFLLSCSKANNVDIQEPIPQYVTLYASFDETRTHLADEQLGDIVWDANDSICLFSNDGVGGSKFVTDEGGSTAEFRGTIETASKYFGLYPYNKSAIFSLSNSTVTTILPDQQSITNDGGTYDPYSFIAVGSSNNTKMGFYNVCGGIRFTLSEPGYKKVTFRGKNNEALAGKVIISLSDTSHPSVSFSETTSNEISLVCDGGFVSDTYYYICFVPQSFSKGFEMEFSGGDKSTKVQSCKSPVTVNRSSFSTIHNADKDGVLDGIMNGEDLSVNSTANCYIVNKPGSYKFKMTMGNSDYQVKNVDHVSVLWETNNTASSCGVGTIIEKCSLKRDYLCFRTPESLTDGNALLAAFDEGNNILWSWHIWVCGGYDPDATSQTYLGSNKVMMDRNIGALSTQTQNPLSNGLMYQWGRKDPFMGSSMYSISADLMMSTNPALYEEVSETTGTITYAIAHPNVFLKAPTSVCEAQDWIYSQRDNSLWGENKTMYDPCPSGWKVPSGVDDNSPWKKSTSYGTRTYGAYFTHSTGDAWYPANGFLSCNGVLFQSGQYALYWTSYGNSQFVRTLEIYLKTGSEKVYPSSDGHIRSEGHSVRCVEE